MTNSEERMRNSEGEMLEGGQQDEFDLVSAGNLAWGAVTGLVLGALLFFAVELSAGCSAPGARAGTVDHNTVALQAEVTAALASAETLDAELTVALAAVETLETELTGLKMGDINIGGEGDSVTTWMLVAGLILSTPGGGLFYQLILRPVRRKREKRITAENAKSAEETKGR